MENIKGNSAFQSICKIATEERALENPALPALDSAIGRLTAQAAQISEYVGKLGRDIRTIQTSEAFLNQQIMEIWQAQQESSRPALDIPASDSGLTLCPSPSNQALSILETELESLATQKTAIQGKLQIHNEELKLINFTIETMKTVRSI